MPDRHDESIRLKAQESQHAAGAAQHAERQHRLEREREMTFASYHKAAAQTAKFARETQVTYNAFKLAGEAGEITDKLGKGIMSGDFGYGEDGEFLSDDLKQSLIREAGDALWHLDAFLTTIGSSLEEAAEVNVNKLADRFRREVILGDGDER